eukprot:597142-Pyramimonas_sp.AAC.1
MARRPPRGFRRPPIEPVARSCRSCRGEVLEVLLRASSGPSTCCSSLVLWFFRQSQWPDGFSRQEAHPPGLRALEVSLLRGS